MEAKETVMSTKRINEVYLRGYLTRRGVYKQREGLKALVYEQAEITAPIFFKAGIKEGEQRLAERISYPHWQEIQDSKQAGIKEVVEWTDEICPGHCQRNPKGSSMFGEIVFYSNGRRLKKRDCLICWQAQKKEWGINED